MHNADSSDVLLSKLEFQQIGLASMHAEQTLGSSEASPQPPAFRLDIATPDSASLDEQEELVARISLAAEVFLPHGQMSAVAYEDFKVEREHLALLTPARMTAFANDYVVPELLPFLREALHSMGGKVFQTEVMMPMFRKGDVSFEKPQ